MIFFFFLNWLVWLNNHKNNLGIIAGPSLNIQIHNVIKKLWHLFLPQFWKNLTPLTEQHKSADWGEQPQAESVRTARSQEKLHLWTRSAWIYQEEDACCLLFHEYRSRMVRLCYHEDPIYNIQRVLMWGFESFCTAGDGGNPQKPLTQTLRFEVTHLSSKTFFGLYTCFLLRTPKILHFWEAHSAIIHSFI